jgi:predicted transcriptional regulator
LSKRHRTTEVDLTSRDGGRVDAVSSLRGILRGMGRSKIHRDFGDARATLRRLFGVTAKEFCKRAGLTRSCFYRALAGDVASRRSVVERLDQAVASALFPGEHKP